MIFYIKHNDNYSAINLKYQLIHPKIQVPKLSF